MGLAYLNNKKKCFAEADKMPYTQYCCLMLTFHYYARLKAVGQVLYALFYKT